MIALSLLLVTVAVLLGAAASIWHIRDPATGSRPPAWLAVTHGALASAGVILLIFALGETPDASASGVAGFDDGAVVLFAVAILAGLAIPALRRWRGRVPGVLVAVHAGIAVTGYVIFLAWAFLR